MQAITERLLRCANCGGIAPEASYRYGCCRTHGQHPEHRICPSCRASIDWNGYSIVAADLAELDGWGVGR